MNAIDLFEQLGVLQKVRWKSSTGYTKRIDQRRGNMLHTSVELRFCGTWIPDKPMDVREFLKSHLPDRRR